MDYGEHGRCEALAKTTGERCRRHAVGDHGKCDKHGGATPVADGSPHFKHGLFSDHLNDEDQRTVEILEDFESREKLEELINWRLARLRRAVKALNDQAEQRSFWDAFAEIVDSAGPIEAEEIGELASMLDRGNRAMQQEIDLVRKLIKDFEHITEGQKHQVDAGSAWRELLQGGDE